MFPNVSFSRRFLFLGYVSGLQIWDCTYLGSVSELLNLTSPQWGRVAYSAVLSPPHSSDGDSLNNQRPVIGIVYAFSYENWQ